MMIDVIGIQLNVGLIILLIILGAFVWYGFSIIYHLIRFGVGRGPKIATLIFFIGSMILSSAVIGAYNQVDWGEFSRNIQNINRPA